MGHRQSHALGESVSCCRLFGSELALSSKAETKETDSAVTPLEIYPMGLWAAKTRNNQSTKQWWTDYI